MLPERLSTDLTSLNEGEERAAVVIEMVVQARRRHRIQPRITGRCVRNRAQLTYSAVGPWLEGTAAAPPKVAASADLERSCAAERSGARCCARRATEWARSRSTGRRRSR